MRQLINLNQSNVLNCSQVPLYSDDSLNSTNGSISSSTCTASSPPMSNGYIHQPQTIFNAHSNQSVYANNGPFQINHGQHSCINNNYVQRIPQSTTMPTLQSNVDDILPNLSAAPITWNNSNPNDLLSSVQSISNMEPQRSFESFAANFYSPPASVYMLENNGSAFPAFSTQ